MTTNPIPEAVLSTLGAPACRALQSHQILSLEILSTYSKKELLQFHGLGKSAVPKLEAALHQVGRNFNKYTIELRPSVLSDLEFFFQFQLDPIANQLAAFTSEDYADKNAYMEKFVKLLNNPTIHNETIRVDGIIAGSIAKFEIDNEAEVTYWIDRKFWSKGVATAALHKFLMLENARPLSGRVAYDNFGSQRVLERCGFVKIGKDRGFANARQMEVEEFIYKINLAPPTIA